MTGLTDRSPADEVLLSVIRAAMAVSVRAADELGDVSAVQLRALTVVWENPGVNLLRLAQAMGVTASKASRLVDRLARRDLVTVEPDAADRRARVVRPSRAGTALRRRLIGRRRDMLSERLSAANLPTDLLSGLETIGRALADRR